MKTHRCRGENRCRLPGWYGSVAGQTVHGPAIGHRGHAPANYGPSNLRQHPNYLSSVGVDSLSSGRPVSPRIRVKPARSRDNTANAMQRATSNSNSPVPGPMKIANKANTAAEARNAQNHPGEVRLRTTHRTHRTSRESELTLLTPASNSIAPYAWGAGTFLTEYCRFYNHDGNGSSTIDRIPVTAETRPRSNGLRSRKAIRMMYWNRK